jgi:predicted phage terminase large subunit-like protein
MPEKLRISLHPTQAAFRQSNAIYRGFVGGRGAGKSWIGAYDLIRRAIPRRLYLVAAPTYPMLRDSSIRTFEEIARSLGYIRDITTSAGNARAVLGNGAEVLFRSAENPNRLRGPNISGAWLDESGDMDYESYLIVAGCLREGGEQGWLSSTFTPRGRQHWTFEVFGKNKPDTELFTARTSENPFLPEGFEDRLRDQYTSSFAEQELAGRFVDLAGTVAKREWFKVVDQAPKCRRYVRAWDFAATPENAKGEGDYTVGALLGELDKRWYLCDIVRSRVAGGQVAALVKATAAQDGKDVQITIEQEGGSSGKIVVSYMVGELAGYNVHHIKPSSDKLTRAMPFLAQAEAGNIVLQRANWNAAYLDEMTSFTGKNTDAHDDQVDATSHAFNSMHTNGVQISFSV